MYNYKLSMDYVIKRAQGAQEIRIVGASISGKQLLAYLQNENLHVEAFYDNDESLCGKLFSGVRVMCLKDQKTLPLTSLYIIASVNFKSELKDQLLRKGIPDSSIIMFCLGKDYDYFRDLEEEFYEEEVQDIYYRNFGRYMDLKKPSTYNEKINWQKIYDQDERKVKLTDKYLVRKWIEEKIGASYLTKLYGIWSDANDIDFSLLPTKYALKLNHGAGWNIIVNGCRIDEGKIRAQLNEWKNLNFAYYTLEMHYKNIKPRILCEEYLENANGDLYDYKVFCFHGKPKYIMFLAERHTKGLKMAFYDTEWNKQPFVYSYPMYEKEVPKPCNLDEMLELSRILSEGFSHVRVDWYNLPKNRLVFGEMTFTSCSGFADWNPKEYDQILGELI